MVKSHHLGPRIQTLLPTAQPLEWRNVIIGSEHPPNNANYRGNDAQGYQQQHNHAPGQECSQGLKTSRVVRFVEGLVQVDGGPQSQNSPRTAPETTPYNTLAPMAHAHEEAARTIKPPYSATLLSKVDRSIFMLVSPGESSSPMPAGPVLTVGSAIFEKWPGGLWAYKGPWLCHHGETGQEHATFAVRPPSKRGNRWLSALLSPRLCT